MTQYGDYQEPGIVTEETSAQSLIQTADAPSVPCIVGPADLANASDPASVNTTYEVTKSATAQKRFGASSLLTEAVTDMLREGAAPVLAIATEGVAVTGEDLSGLGGTSGTLTNGPVSEDPADTTFTVDGVALTTVITYDDPTTKTPADGEAYLNPVTKAFELDAAPGDADDSNDTVDYTYYDYTSALDALEANVDASEAVDFLAAIQETDAVQDDVQATVTNLASEQKYAVALLASDVRVDPSTYTNPYDDSRVQVVGPTRFEDNSSALAAYAGRRAFFGLNRTPIGQSLASNKALAVSLSRDERGALIDENVVPLENRSGGAVIKDDKTAVTSSNTDEANIDFGFKRLVLDYTYATAHQNEEPFIGLLNQPHIRNALEDLIRVQLTALKASYLIDGFALSIEEDSATTARLNLQIDAPEPLRFIVNDATIGRQ